jgi:hypothetical protein
MSPYSLTVSAAAIALAAPHENHTAMVSPNFGIILFKNSLIVALHITICVMALLLYQIIFVPAYLVLMALDLPRLTKTPN